MPSSLPVPPRSASWGSCVLEQSGGVAATVPSRRKGAGSKPEDTGGSLSAPLAKERSTSIQEPKTPGGGLRRAGSSAGQALVPINPLTVGVDPAPLREYEVASRQAIKNGYIPGCASVVLRQGQVVHVATYGYANLEEKVPFQLDTLCRLVCMTKSYIATAFMSLVDEGRASLEDRLDKYLPTWSNVKVLPEGATAAIKPNGPILLRHIISHTSGIGYSPDKGDEAEGDVAIGYARLRNAVLRGQISTLRTFVDKLAQVPLVCHPGENYEYGFSMDVLGRVLEVIMGKDLEVCLRERVFEPLGMRNTKWFVHEHELDKLAACYGGATTWGKIYGDMKDEVPSTPRRGLVRIDGAIAEHSGWRHGRHCRVKMGGGYLTYIQGGLVSTVEDTVCFLQMLIGRGVAPSGQRLLKEKTLESMERNCLKSSWGKGKACYLGNIGAFREGGKEYGMGGAACTYWSMDREDDVACAWFAQHLDMPDYTDMKGVDPKRIDLWQAMYDAVRSKKVARVATAATAAAGSGKGEARAIATTCRDVHLRHRVKTKQAHQRQEKRQELHLTRERTPAHKAVPTASASATRRKSPSGSGGGSSRGEGSNKRARQASTGLGRGVASEQKIGFGPGRELPDAVSSRAGEGDIAKGR